MIHEVTFDENQWLNFWKYYKGQPHQVEAVKLLREHILKVDPCLLTDTADWVEAYRDGPTEVEQFDDIAGRFVANQPLLAPQQLVDYPTISETGLQLIKEFEGLRLEAYYCPSGVLTIGYGSTGSHVKPGMVIDEETAESLLYIDLERFEHAVCTLVQRDLTQHEYDALVSFAFNCGIGALESSTLLRRLNGGDPKPIVFTEELQKWVNGPDGPLPGLVRRRDAEIALALS